MERIQAMTVRKVTMQIPEDLLEKRSLRDEVRSLEQRKAALAKELLDTHRAVEAVEAGIFELRSQEAHRRGQQKRIHENKLRAKALRLRKVLAELKKDGGQN